MCIHCLFIIRNVRKFNIEVHNMSLYKEIVSKVAYSCLGICGALDRKE
jgi:hypothetical protein